MFLLAKKEMIQSVIDTKHCKVAMDIQKVAATHDIELQTKPLQEIQIWISNICDSLQQLHNKKVYFFGYGYSNMTQEKLDVFLKYVEQLLIAK